MPDPPGRDGRAIALLLLLLAAVTFLVCAARYLPSPLRFDEAEFPPQAEAILRHGVPTLDYAEDQRLFTRPYYGYDAHYGMWHPPGYLYSLAAVMAVFGRSDSALRGLSLGWTALAIWIGWLVVMRNESAPPGRAFRLIPVGVAALCPLIVHGSFLVDIDNTILCASMFLMAWLHVVLPADRPWRRRAWLGAAFALALWSKLTTPPAMVAAIGIDLLLRHRPRQAGIDTLAVGTFGIGLFAATYWLYCSVLDYPPNIMFDLNYVGKQGAYLSLQSIPRMLQALRWNVVWISPPLMLAFAWVATLRVRRYIQLRRHESGDVVLVFSLIVLSVYTGMAVMGDYTVPAAVGIALVVGAEAARALASLRTHQRALVAGAAGVLAGLHIWFLRPLTVRPAGVDTPSTLSAMLADDRVIALAVAIAAGVTFVILASRQMRTSRPGGAVLAALLIWVGAANAPSELRVAAAPFDRSPLRPFEERGFGEVVAFVNEHARPEERLLCPKDVGYYFRGRYYALDPGEPGDNVEERLVAAAGRGVRFVVDSTMYPLLPDARHIEAAGFARRATVGDFVVYERRAD